MVADTPPRRQPPSYETLQREREQEERIRKLLAEMRPQRAALRVAVDHGSQSSLQEVPGVPPFDAPPPYPEWMDRPRSQLTSPDSWLFANPKPTAKHSPGWSRNPRPLSTAPHSPAGRFLSLEVTAESPGPAPLRQAVSPAAPLHKPTGKSDDRRHAPSSSEVNGNLLLREMLPSDTLVLTKGVSQTRGNPPSGSHPTLGGSNSISGKYNTVQPSTPVTNRLSSDGFRNQNGNSLPNRRPLRSSNRAFTQPLVAHRQYLNSSDDDLLDSSRKTSTFDRGSGRQASFMAAVAGFDANNSSTNTNTNSIASTGEHSPLPPVARRSSLRAALELFEGQKSAEALPITPTQSELTTPRRKTSGENSTDKRRDSRQLFRKWEREDDGEANCSRVVMRSPIVHTRRRDHRSRRATHIGSPKFAAFHMDDAAASTNGRGSPSACSVDMLRQRPKSYVLATSSSYPLPEAHSATSDTPSPSVRAPLSFPSCESLDRRSVPLKSGAPHPPATHRLTRFIQLFSQHHDHQKDAATSQEKASSRRHLPLKRSRTAGPTGRIPLPPPTPVPAVCVEKQGLLMHQEHPMGTSAKKQRSSHWEQRWAVLAGKNLFLCKQLSSYVSESKEKMYSVPSDAQQIDVDSAIVDIAYDTLRADEGAKYVVRVVSLQHREHLLSVKSEDDMLSWIAALQKAAISDPDMLRRPRKEEPLLPASTSDPTIRDAQTPNATTQLIMHRYKAKTSQLSSPLSGKRASQSSTSGGAHHQNFDGHSAQPGTSSEPPSTGSSNGQCDSTPKSGRKWKKSKAGKQGSSSSASSAPSFEKDKNCCALGHKITDCPTSGEGDLVPLIVQLCVRVVEAHGLDTVGIYRIPGNTAAVNALKEALNQGVDQIDFEDSRWKDVNVVSSLLKMFLRKLPEPLLTDKLYPFFIDANRMSNHPQRLHKLRNLLRKMPRAHYETLKFLIGHLNGVTRHCDVNKMECRNLALMFGPSIVRPSDDNMATMVTHMSDQCKIIETFINYFSWMFDDQGTAEDPVPEMVPTQEIAPPGGGATLDAGPAGVSSSSFNDMHNLIRRANEEQAADLMREGKGNKIHRSLSIRRSSRSKNKNRFLSIKNILNVRRNSRRDKSKSKLKIESTAPAALNPLPSANQSSPRHSSAANHNSAFSKITPTQSSVDSAFCGVYQERDIDAEIASRQTSSPLAFTSQSMVEHSPSLESSLGSLPDTSRTAPELRRESMSAEEAAEMRRKRQETLASARRIFIAGSGAGADKAPDNATMDALVSHTQHLNLVGSPALEVLSEATREKIRRLQQGGVQWSSLDKNTIDARSREASKKREAARETVTIATDRNSPRDPAKHSPTRDDAMSFTSDYSTTSSLPITLAMTVSVSDPLATTSSDYASSDVSPCARQASASPRTRPKQLAIAETRCEQKIRLRGKSGAKDPKRRHTITDMDTLRESGAFGKFARWLGLRKSSPDVRDESTAAAMPAFEPPAIVRTSPNELTPASGDEQL